MKIILIGHGETGVAFKNAVEMIFGKADDLIPLTFKQGEGIKDITEKIQSAITNFDSNKVLVVTDLFSGTPYNAAAAMALKGQVKDVIAGMSLPIMLEIVTQMNTSSIEKLVIQILKDSPKFTRALSQELNIQEKEDDF